MKGDVIYEIQRIEKIGFGENSGNEHSSTLKIPLLATMKERTFVGKANSAQEARQNAASQAIEAINGDGDLAKQVTAQTETKVTKKRAAAVKWLERMAEKDETVKEAGWFKKRLEKAKEIVKIEEKVVTPP